MARERPELDAWLERADALLAELDDVQYLAVESLKPQVENHTLQAHVANHLLRKTLGVQVDVFDENDV